MRNPEPIARLEEDERATRVVAADDFCTLIERDGIERHFARGLLEIPTDDGSYFGYGAWVELGAEEITRLAERWDDPRGGDEPPFPGTLANELTPYVGTEGLRATLHLRDVTLLPRIELAGDHELVRDARVGISPERANELGQVAYHAA
jgi:hypothetical protein